MIQTIKYQLNNSLFTVNFATQNAKLPVLRKNGDVRLVIWGRRPAQTGNLPLGGWARQESIESEWWQPYFPRPVKLPLVAFMEKDIEGKPHWFELTKGQWVQGLLARYDQELRVYMVTVTPQLADAVYDVWPRIKVG